MAKKTKIAIARSEEFKDIDDELDRAMDRLEDTNARIDVVLSEHEGDDASEAVDGEEDPEAGTGKESDGEEEKGEDSEDSS